MFWEYGFIFNQYHVQNDITIFHKDDVTNWLVNMHWSRNVVKLIYKN